MEAQEGPKAVGEKETGFSLYCGWDTPLSKQIPQGVCPFCSWIFLWDFMEEGCEGLKYHIFVYIQSNSDSNTLILRYHGSVWNIPILFKF